MSLTKRQKEILDFITGFIDAQGYSPSMEEIARHFGFASLNAVYKHLEALQARGYLRRDPNHARSIAIPSVASATTQELPLYGYVAAGRPIEAVSTPATFTVPEEFLSGRSSHYVLQVKGESMIDEHIEDGDFVVVESREEARDGEMVIALVDEENVTLKRFYREGDRIRLQPANSHLSPIILDANRVRIQGVAVGVMRRYR